MSNLLDSLSASEEIFPYLSYIHQDLWSLGSNSQCIIDLVSKHIPSDELNHVLDLGCGKGEVLVRLNQHLSFKGTGIDIVPAYIESANHYAAKFNIGSLEFKVGDITEAVDQYANCDLVIYGHDSEVFGDVRSSIAMVTKPVTPSKWLVFESVYSLSSNNQDFPNQKEFDQQVKDSGLQLVNMIKWDASELRATNARNTELMNYRVEELRLRHPHMTMILDEFMAEQAEECHELENELQCVTLLLKK